MTYSKYCNQEVPTWESFQTQMYDLTLPELLAEQEQSLMTETEIKIEDTYSPVYYQPATPGSSSMLGSPSMNMPVLCQAFNVYSPVQGIQSLASPSNTYAQSPGSSTYSASPINSPQRSLPPEDFLRYGLRQAFQARHGIPQVNDYGYYYSEYSGSKRRRRDDELSPDEYEKRRLRRERNKQAALRCRTRRRERIDALEQETSEIEEQNQKVESEIKSLKKQLEEFKDLLKDHKCNKQINLNDEHQSKSQEVKVEPEQF